MDLALRRRIGGWAALAIALTIPLLVVGVAASRDGTDPSASTPILVVEIVRGTAIAVAAWGLDALYRQLSAQHGIVLATGLVAGIGIVALDVLLLVGLLKTPMDDPFTIVLNACLGAWYVGSGLILAAGGPTFRRIGLTAQVGGVGTLLATATTILLVLDVLPTVARSGLQVATLLGLFSLVFVVRIWWTVGLDRQPPGGPI